MTSASPSRTQSLHTIGDVGASDYINEVLTDNENENAPLLQHRSELPHYANLPNNSRHSYYIHQSYDETITQLQHQDSTDRFGLSPVRRMFLLLSLFDFLLSFLLWIIYLQLLPGEILEKIKGLQFDIRRTFIDVVLMSFLRSALLLIVYSCVLRVKKWYAVALTTTASTAFLLTKVIYTKFSNHGQPMNYMLIIFSFVICWCEAWHFDFQVIPRESDLLTSSVPPRPPPQVNVRPPSVRGYPPNYGRTYSRVGGKSSAFFTPYAGSVYRGKSPDTDEDTDSNLSNLSEELNKVEERDRGLIRIGNDTVHMVFRMLYINDGWQLQKEEKDNITVHARHFDGVGKVFKLETIIDAPRYVLDKLFWEDLDSQPSWNASVKECQIVLRVNRKTDIVYSVTAEAGSGVIASREFVMLRRRKKQGPLTILSSASVETDLYPINKSIIRGKNGPGGWVLREMEGEPDKTEFIWLLNTELKGWLPQSLVEQSLGSVMVDTARDIKQHVASLPF